MALPWAWPLAETFHFIGLCLLVGIVGMFDLRILGIAKGLPLASLKRLLPWGVFGFVLCLVTGALFVLGIGANLYDDNAYDVIARDQYLQLKLLFIFFAVFPRRFLRPSTAPVMTHGPALPRSRTWPTWSMVLPTTGARVGPWT